MTISARRRTLLGALLLSAGAPRVLLAGGCQPTAPNALGPFYRKDAPFRSALAGGSEPGEPLVVTGRVLAGDGCTPLPGAVVDAWHANAEGRYYNVRGRDEPAAFQLRGRVKTNDRGEYRFETVMPGAYASRPRHVHFIASHARAEALVTQMYFVGDPRLETDPLVRQSLIVERHGDTAQFDIILRT